MLSRFAMPHPGKDGQSFFRRNGSTGDPQKLTAKRIQQGLAHETSDCHNRRLANVTSFLAGNLRQLVGITNLSPTAQERTEDTQSIRRKGIPQLASFSTSDGKKLAQAARFFDFNAGEERNEEDLAVALVHLFKVIPKLSSWCQRSELYSVELFAASLQIWEAVAVVDDREVWAESLHVQREKTQLIDIAFYEISRRRRSAVASTHRLLWGSLLDRDEHTITMAILTSNNCSLHHGNSSIDPVRRLQEVDVRPALVCLETRENHVRQHVFALTRRETRDDDWMCRLPKGRN